MSKRRGRDSSGNMDPSRERRKRYEAVLRPLGLWDAFAAVPRILQELFLRIKLPDPLLVLEPDAAEALDPAARRCGERLLRSASIKVKRPADGKAVEAEAETKAESETDADVDADAKADAAKADPDDTFDMSARDFIGVVTGTMLMIRYLNSPMAIDNNKKMPDSFHAFVAAAGPVLERIHADHLNDAFNAMYRGVMVPLVSASRLDERLFTANLVVVDNERAKKETRVVVSLTKPQARQVVLDGSARTMYRVGKLACASSRVQWLSWDGKVLRDHGMAGTPGRAYQVFAQAHALRQLHARVNVPGPAEFAEAWLAESLAEPKVVERQGADLLVEYRIKDYRIGYLIVTPLPGIVAVRTFLFLTMQNTPEGRRLERRLNLTRDEVDYLGLHELSAFTTTDLGRDDKLRKLLGKCGCGHLFDLMGKDCAPDAAEPLADEVKKYLRLAA